MTDVTKFTFGRSYILKQKGFATRFYELTERDGDRLTFKLRQKDNHQEISGTIFIPEGENEEVFAFFRNGRRAFLTANNYIPKGYKLTKEQWLFIKSAWQLFNHRDEILADPRKAYAPIDMQNVLAYASPLEGATIGAYVEWWMQCADALHTNERGLPCLMVRFSGSPLSGKNVCMMVARDGAIEECCSPQFHDTWHQFLDICKRYKQTTLKVEPYTLDEVASSCV